MTAPPREPQEIGIKQYESTAAFISKIIGKPVKYEHPGNWLTYQSNMRNNKYDIVFDGPHFASWRMAHISHDMLVKLPGKLQFYLLTDINNSQINSADDLIGKKICGISPPNLSTLSVLAYYQNPVRQPIIKGIKGGMGKVHKTFKSGGCEALVLRTAFYYKKLQDADRKSLKIIYKSPAMPNQVISAGKRLTQEEKSRLRVALISNDGAQATKPTLQRFGGKAKAFIPATAKEYEGYNNLLEGVIFGW
jgi:ABC-type phosphate/phosphonate transport system substrate-binding protein